MEIRLIKYSDIPPEIIAEGKKNKLIFRDQENAHYFGGFINGRLICLTCLVINKNKTGSIKSNFTLEEYRGKGHFTELNNYCLDFARKTGLKRILLNCLKDSAKIHNQAGARIWKVTKNIFWLIYDEGF